ncbi:MAG: ethanolamine ammonia-lyase reactivating factor EutA [Candidatus Thorarchaeota archaeon]|nr:MAG: ethanolamine ammonia-lyase reactivating factor EutA [Candidatus Thorarchaeota archaeon]
MTVDKAENMKSHVIRVVKDFFETHFSEDSEVLSKSFKQNYDTLLQQDGHDATSEVEGIRRLIVSFKPALSSVLEPCQEYDTLLTMVLWMFKAPWEGAHRRRKKPSPRRDGPVMPGSDQSMDISFLCTVCGEEVDVPHDRKMQILNSEDEVELPTHCGHDVKIRISKKQEEPKDDEVDEDEPIVPVELLMGHLPADNVEYMKVLSVGIDIGSSTSHLIFSRLTLKREKSLFNITNRFNLVNREIIYESSIIFTPLIDRYNIDVESVIEFCEEEYKKAGITPEMVETGAVIVTGETAKKQNAAEIVSRLSSESGRFVSAAAGPNLESLLSAMGSGIVDQTLHSQRSILHVDVGGGTSNLAIISNGQVRSTSCINVGGRLLGIDKDLKIWRIDGPAQFIMNELGITYQIGDTILEKDARDIARELAKALVEVMQGEAKSIIAKELMMTDDLDFLIPVDEYSFSGGVSEMYFGSDADFDDIGAMLADEIRALVEDQGLNVVEPPNKIRATVIGAGAFSLSVSGSTTFFDESIELPVTNVPVLPVDLGGEEFTPEKLVDRIRRSFTTFDMVEGADLVALYFKDLVVSRAYIGDEWLPPFAKAIEEALPNSVSKKKLIILIFGYDVAKRLGLAIRDETSIKSNILVLDELQLEAGDWIDIGIPLKETQAFPVTVKSLVFNENKEYS